MRYFGMRGRWFIVLSFVVAGMLEILPMPACVVWMRPAWVALVLAYWVMALPELVGVGWAFTVGVLLDVLHGTLLGEHALALVLVAYVIIKMHKLLRVYPLMQQTMVVGTVILGYQVVLCMIQAAIQCVPHVWLYGLGSIVSMLLWPWVFIMLRDGRRRFHVV